MILYKGGKLVYVTIFSCSQMRQTEQKVKITEEGSTKIVKFTNPGAGVIVLERGHKFKH